MKFVVFYLLVCVGLVLCKECDDWASIPKRINCWITKCINHIIAEHVAKAAIANAMTQWNVTIS